MDYVFNNSWFLGVLLAIWLYITRFNEMSETELVRWSYLWLPLIIFGAVGCIALKSGIRTGLENPTQTALITSGKWTVVGMAGLIIFYEVMWEQL